jgi:hypothetical protein
MNTDKAEFLPFHAINNFMLPEFRQSILQEVLSNLDSLSPERRGAINGQLKRLLKVPGFRNSANAPIKIKIKNSVTPFERNPEFVAQIVAGWTELNLELRQQVFDLLTERGWEMLPIDADRTKLPGFLTRWPAKETFEAVNAAFHEKYPEQQTEDNDISLMTVWLSDRLPYDLIEEEEDSGEQEEQES